MTPIERRVAKLEAVKRAGTARPVPNILFVGINETQADAHIRFAAGWPNRKPGHAVLVVPAKPANAADEEVFERRFAENQMALVAAARRERIAIVKADQSTPHAPPKVWPSSPTIRPSSGPHLVWKPQC